MQTVKSSAVATLAEPEVLELRQDARSDGKPGDSCSRLGHLLCVAEWIVVSLIAIVTVALHVRFVTSVGGLWRDETNSVNLSSLLTFSEVWRFLDYDSFPILFFAVLRGWIGIFGADNDTALRALGLMIGLGILLTLWRNARSFGAGLPVLSLALIGLNPMVIRYGDSTRAYGLGMLLILLTFGVFWRLAAQPRSISPKRIAAATLLALLSVHCLYYNSILLFAIAAGAIAVALRNRSWRTAGIVLGIGMLAAASLLPYVPMMRRMHEWTFLVNFPVDFAWIWKRAGEVTGSPDPLTIWLWAGLSITGVTIIAGVGLWNRRDESARRRKARIDGLFAPALNNRKSLPPAVVFAGIALVIGVAGYALFLRVLNYYTQPWYYVTVVVFAACALEVIFGAWPAIGTSAVLSLALRGVRLVAAISLLGLASLPAWEEMPTRHTNVDLLAARLLPMTATGDLILAPRWECAITLSRYYHGPAEIVSLPPLKDHRFHRYDLLLKAMMTPGTLQPVLARIEETLRAGRRVFIAGSLPLPPADYEVPIAAAAYRDLSGKWHGGSSQESWQLQTGQFLHVHATRAARIKVPLPVRATVQGFEDLDLFVVEGWR